MDILVSRTYPYYAVSVSCLLAALVPFSFDVEIAAFGLLDAYLSADRVVVMFVEMFFLKRS